MLLAFFTMTIDHIGMIFFPEVEWWRIVGRIAFPLFAWGIVRWFLLTSQREKYAKRIFILALISQIPFFFLEWQVVLNVCFTLFLGLISLSILEAKQIGRVLKIILIAFFAGIASLFLCDYGAYWVLTIVLLKIFWQQKRSILYFSLLTFLFYNIDYTTGNILYHPQIYAPIALGILYLTPIQKYDFPLNFWFKYGYYPIHLTILLLIDSVLFLM